MKVTFDKTWKIGPIAMVAIATFGLGIVNLYVLYSTDGRASDRKLTAIETKVEFLQRSVERIENRLIGSTSLTTTTSR